MDDLKERFAEADRMMGRDHWRDIADRAAKPERPSHVLEWPPAPRRRIAAAVVAFAVFAAVAVFAWDLPQPDRAPSPLPTRPAADPPVDLAAELPPGWSNLPPPPEVRSGAATAWTGSQLLVWGGFVFDGSGDKTPLSDGFVFDAGSRDWSDLVASPLRPRSFPAAAWTGSELVIWGGHFQSDPSQSFDDGAAYDPARETWRRLPDAPIAARAPFSVWTGRELIVWGNASRDIRLRDGAAYDPSADTWRRIAEAPIELSDATAVWTGEEMIVFGSNLNFNNHSETQTAVGAAYDPAANTWRVLPASDLSPQAHTAGWPGSDEMIAWDYEHGTAAFDPKTDGWRRLDDVPLRFYECSPRSATVPGYMFGNFCGQLVTFSTAKDRWREITRADLEGWAIEPIAAGSAFLILAHGFELSDVPGKEFDTRMLAYVPPNPNKQEG
jgi:hypothetical protein